MDIICRGNNNDPEEIGKQMLQMWGKLQNEHIYENVGFKTVEENDEEYIMVCEL